jgi:hypothetical protein
VLGSRSSMPRRRRLGPQLTLAQVKALETDKMQQRTERRIRIKELMANKEDSDTDSEEEGSKAEPVHLGMRTISLLEVLVYGLVWFLIVLCAAFFSALLRVLCAALGGVKGACLLFLRGLTALLALLLAFLSVARLV